ncbi:MAG: AAA family ATPase [Paracoccaceae bacterium]|nr:AAA family ATPase [Paracoccaceae bacterium]
MIIGASGSGKTTLARKLGKATDLPVIHIDPMFFYEGWVQRPRAETEQLIRDAIQAPEWIFEGNCSSTFDERADLADLIVVLELGKYRRVMRTLWRSLRYFKRTRPDMAPGCPERFDLGFHFGWVWGYDSHSKHKVEAFIARWENVKPILRVTSVAMARQFGRNPHRIIRQNVGRLSIEQPRTGL